MATADWRLGVPTLAWFAGYVAFLRYFVPRMRDLARASSEGALARDGARGGQLHQHPDGQAVRPARRRGRLRARVDRRAPRPRSRAHMRVITRFMFALSAHERAAARRHGGDRHLRCGRRARSSAGIVATALPLAWQIANVAGWVSWEVTAIFENIGVVQEGMQSIAVPHSGVDRPGARPLEVSRGEIASSDLSFGYGRQGAAARARRSELTIQPGERVGLVGRSGAGKSTLVNLLLRFHDAEAGRILIDGQDIAHVTQESLRAAIGMVTQDTSLLHRSIAANIRYGRPNASDAQVHGGREKGAGARIHRRAARLEGPGRLRSACRRARRQALRRPAPAHRARARDPEGCADPRARRGHLVARQRGRARDPGAAARADGRQDGDRHRAPAVDDRAHGPPGGARAGRSSSRAPTTSCSRWAATTRSCGATSLAASSPTSLRRGATTSRRRCGRPSVSRVRSRKR